METVHSLSLNDEVVTHTYLEDCKVSLVKTSLGLCIQWLWPGDGTRSSSTSHSAVVTDSKTSGKLFPIRVNAELEKAVFGTSALRTGVQESPKHALIVCNTGVIAAVSHEEPGTVFPLCLIAEQPVWAGVLEASGTAVIAVASKSGFLYLGRHKGSGISWFAETLNSTVLSCCGSNEAFIFCDGVTSWASFLSLDAEGALQLKYQKLPYVGVMRMAEKEGERVELLTCDGRKYMTSWNSLISKDKDEVKSRKTQVDEAPSTIKETMLGIKRCAEKMESEGLQITNLNSYIEQLNIAQTLLLDTKDVFSTSVQIEQHTTSQGVSYSAFVEFTKNTEGLDLEGKWWKLCVSVPTPSGTRSLSLGLDNHSFSPSCTITVPIDQADWSQNLKTVDLECFLLFDHFDASHPLCRIPACVAQVDILHFLTTQRILNKATLHSSSFSEILKNLSKEKEDNDTENTQIKRTAYLSKVSTSFTSEEKNIALVRNIFSSLGCEISLTAQEDHVRLWYHELPLDLHLCKQNDKIVITLEGTKPTIVLAAKIAIEGRVIKQRAPYSKFSLPPSVLRQVRQCHRLFDFESSKATTLAAVTHLHQITSNLMSLLPL